MQPAPDPVWLARVRLRGIVEYDDRVLHRVCDRVWRVDRAAGLYAVRVGGWCVVAFHAEQAWRSMHPTLPAAMDAYQALCRSLAEAGSCP